MDFFEQQDQAHRNTTRLIGLFGLAIASMILTFYLVALIAFAEVSADGFRFIRPGVFLLVSLSILGVIGLGSATKMIELRRGGLAVAESLGGRQINPQTEDFKEQQLLNVVAEMALASGTPIPTVYVLAQESSINAFAAGYAPDDAVIGVTQGCLEQLDRAELQGVIAHEFSHILNGDMRLNLKLMGVIQGLLMIYIMGRVMTNGSLRSRHYHRSNDDDGDGKIVLLGLAVMAVGGIGLIFGRLIKSGVSRQREFLADASAVQFTRNPAGLAGALRRIGGLTSGSRLRSPRAEEASHMFFGEAFNALFMGGWMATHPPLSERIRRITGLKVAPTPTVATAGAAAHSASAHVMGFQGRVTTGQAAAQTSPPVPETTSQFMADIGTVTPQHLDKAQAFLAGLSPDLKAAIATPTGAMALVYGLLLDDQAAVRSQQLALLQMPGEPVDAQQVEQLAHQLHDLDARQHLPLLDLSVPALRTITAAQCAHFFKQIQALVKADGKLSLSEYVLQIILQKRLRPHFQKPVEPPKPVTNLGTAWQDCEIVLATLARAGHTQPDDAFYALKSGLSRLPGANRQELPQTLPKITLAALGQSLKRLGAAVPKLKQAIVDAAAHTVLVDNDVTPREAELLRAIVISLDCPIPPFLERPAKPPAKPQAKVAHAQNGRAMR